MKNFKKFAIILASIIVVIVILIVFRDYWIPMVNKALVWIQQKMGVSGDYFSLDEGWSKGI